MHHIDVDLDVTPFRQVVHEYSGYQSLTDVPKALKFNDPYQDCKVSVSSYDKKVHDYNELLN
jgi:hypothetical protein